MASMAEGSKSGRSVPARTQEMSEIGREFVAFEGAEMKTDDNALVKRLVDSHVDSAAELGLTDEE